jgi:hypothetical protein
MGMMGKGPDERGIFDTQLAMVNKLSMNTKDSSYPDYQTGSHLPVLSSSSGVLSGCVVNSVVTVRSF